MITQEIVIRYEYQYSLLDYIGAGVFFLIVLVGLVIAVHAYITKDK